MSTITDRELLELAAMQNMATRGAEATAQDLARFVDALRAALQLQAAHEPVAFRVLWKRPDGEWGPVSDSWMSGKPSSMMQSDIALQSDRLRFEYAYTAPVAAQEKPDLLRYAQELARGLFLRHYASGEDYASGRVEWAVSDDMAGVLTQIDNMVSGLVRQSAVQAQPDDPPNPTKGMTLGQRIAHVGGRENAAGYIEFGSVMAVDALTQHVMRDASAQGAKDAARYRWLRDQNDWHTEPCIDPVDGTQWNVTIYTPTKIVDPTDDDNLDAAIDAAVAEAKEGDQK